MHGHLSSKKDSPANLTYDKGHESVSNFIRNSFVQLKLNFQPGQLFI